MSQALKLSELIAICEEMQREHGDLPLFSEDLTRPATGIYVPGFIWLAAYAETMSGPCVGISVISGTIDKE